MHIVAQPGVVISGWGSGGLYSSLGCALDSRLSTDKEKENYPQHGIICRFNIDDFIKIFNSQKYAMGIFSKEPLVLEGSVVTNNSPLKLKNPKSKFLSPTSKIKKERKKKKDKINKLKKNLKR